IVRLPRCRGVASARIVPDRPAAKKLVLDSIVVVLAPGGKLSIVAAAPTVSARAIRVPPWRLPPTVVRASRNESSATTRPGLVSTKRMPSSSARVPLWSSEIAIGSMCIAAPPYVLSAAIVGLRGAGFNYLKGNVSPAARSADFQHGSGSASGTEGAGPYGECLRSTASPVAHAAPDESTRPRRRGGDLLTPYELHRDRAGPAEPGDGAAPGRRAGRADARP